jgi:hypothetical protein
MDITAKAVVVACGPPNTLSWISVPPLPIRRIQWWFNLSAEGSGTQVVHECEVDQGKRPGPCSAAPRPTMIPGAPM